MFTPEKEPVTASAVRLSVPVFVVLVLTVIGSLWLGLFPEVFLDLARSITMAAS